MLHFTKQLETTREVIAENPGLYFEIQALNQLTPETGKWLRQALEEWLITVESNDEGGFTTLMRDCHTYLDGANSEGICAMRAVDAVVGRPRGACPRADPGCRGSSASRASSRHLSWPMPLPVAAESPSFGYPPSRTACRNSEGRPGGTL